MPQFLQRMKHISWLFVFLVLAPTTNKAESPQENVRSAVDAMDQWLGTDENSQRWRSFLKSKLLEAQLKKGAQSKRSAVAEVLEKYASETPGLDKPVFVAVRRALDAWLTELSKVSIQEVPIQELPQLAIDSKALFVAIDAKQVQQTKKELEGAVNQLDQFLSLTTSKNRKKWHDFILWDKMQAQLRAEDGPDLKVLQSVGQKYYTNKAGLELSPFTNVRDALLEYVNAVHFSSQPNLKKTYLAQLDQLAARLKSFASKPTTTDALAIGRTIGWLDSAGQAHALVTAIRRHYCQPNLYGYISDDLIASGINRDINDTEAVNEYILGTSITGTAETKGKVTARLIPNKDAASIEIRMVGIATSNNVGYNGPVTIYSIGTTNIDARKILKIDSQGLHAEPAVANCSTSSEITNISARTRVVQNVAWQKVGESKYEAEQIASKRAAERVQHRMDNEAKEMLTKANASFVDKFRNPLIRRGAFPQQLQLSTTADELKFRVMQANAYQISATTPAPPLATNHDLAVRIHESLVGNLSESVLGGQTLTDEKLAKLMEELTGSVPQELQIGPEKDPWSITFAASQPISVSFYDGNAKVSLRGRRFTRGENVIKDAMEISAVYKMQKTTSGIKLTRQGDVTVVYVKGGRQSVAQTVFKTFVQKKFTALFKEEIAGDGISLSGKWENVGKLRLRQLDCLNGWIALGWEKPSDDVRTAKKEK